MKIFTGNAKLSDRMNKVRLHKFLPAGFVARLLMMLILCLGMGKSWGQVNHLVISQVYGGGGNSGATYQNDFVELFNPTGATVSLTGWSMQQASAAGTTWSVTTLSGSIAAGKYFLIKLATGGAVGSVLPTADITNLTPNLSVSGGKVLLANTTTAFTVANPTGSSVIDLVGWGTAGFFEGTAAATAHANTTADIRASAGCTDNDQNSTDFSVATPNPRNSSTAANICLYAPTLTTPTVTAIITTGATLGATVTSNGGATLTARGTVWATTAAPTANSLAEGGTAVSAFSHARTGMTPNTAYFYRGYATNSQGTSYSPDGSFTTIHNAPTSAAASSITTGGFTANWTAPTGGGAATFTYTLTYGTDPLLVTGNTTVTSIASGTLLRAVSGLTANTKYYYAVTAVNAGGTSASSSIQEVTTLHNAPVSAAASLIGTDNFTANWTSPSGGGSEPFTYTLTYGTDPALVTGNSNVTGISSATLSNLISGLTPNTKYYYKITAVNAGGNSASSAIQNATTLHNAPTIGTPTSIGSAGFTANWTAPSGGGPAAFTYTLQYSTTADFSSGNISITGISSASTSQAISGLAAGTQYWYRILANNAGGDGAWSGTETATTTSAVVPTLTTPSSASITNVSAVLGATVSSDGGAALTDRGTVYDVTASPVANTLSEGGTTVSAFSHSRTGLNPNTFYYFRGYAVNSIGTGYSPDGTFTTQHNAPTSAAASSITAVGFTANWTAPTGGGSETYTFTLQYSTTSDFSSGNTSVTGISSGTLSYAVSGLTGGTNYWYRVLANNAGGNSAWSAIESLTTLAGLPVLTLPTSAAITTNSATLGATITSNGGGALSERGTVYDITANPTANALAEGGTTVSIFTQFRSGFTPNTFYYYRGYAINAAGTAYSPDGIFTTLHNAPNSAAASAITGNGFTANWTAPAGGGSEAYTYTLQYSTSATFASGNVSITNISSAATSQAVNGLLNGTQYWYRILANNAGGNSAWSGTQTLTTLALPTLTTPTVSAITTTGATLGATVTADGGTALTSRGTVWATTAAPTANALAEGGTTVSVFTHARTGMTPNTVYFYRGYAINSVGTAYSPDGSFTTIHNAPTSTAASSITSSGFTANWTAPAGGGAATFTYTLTYGTDPLLITGNTTITAITSGTLLRAVTGLTSNTTYYYAVTAVNAGGTSVSSAIQTVTTTPQPPGVLLAEENFTFSGLLSSNGYVVTSVATPTLSASGSSLSFNNYGSTNIGNSLTLATSGEDVAKSITVTNSPATVYGSLLIKVSAAQATGDYFFALSPSSGSSTYRARTFIKSSGAGFVLGISCSGSTITYGSTVLSFNTTYQIVIKYSFVSATSAVASLYVNPSMIEEPSSFEVSNTENTVANAPADIAYFAIRQGSASNSPTLTIDGIRIATGWGAATGNPQYFDNTPIASGNYNDVSTFSGATTALLGNVSINNQLTLTAGTLTVGANTLSLNGPAIAGTAANLVTGSSSSLSFGGSSTGISIPSNITALTNLTINNSNGVGLNSSPALSGVLSLTTGSLSLGSNTLTLNGTVTGGGTLTGSASSNLVIGGTGALGTLNFNQGTDGSTNVLNSMTVNRTSSGTLSLGNKLVILDSYVPTAGVLTTGGFLTLRSTATKTARIGANASGADYISGTVKVERYMPSRRAWALVTAPVRNAGSIWLNWQNNGTPSSTYGVNIWGPTGTNPTPGANGLNQGPAYSMKGYNNVANSWSNTVNDTKATTLSNNAGSNNGGAADNKSFLLFATNPYDGAGTNITPSGSAATTLVATGTLQQGNQTLAVSANAYDLVGNPYASPVNFASLATHNSSIQDRFWVYDATMAPYGGYKLVANVSGSYKIVQTNEDAGDYIHIQSGQAVFVEPTGAGNITFSESDKSVPGTSPDIFTTPTTPPQELYIGLKKDNNLLDGALAMFGSIYSADILAAEDARKVYNDGVNVAIDKGVNGYTIEARPEITAKDTTFLWFWNAAADQTYRFSFKANNFNPLINAWLEDAFTGSRTPINLGGTPNEIAFSTTSDAASRALRRFRIVYSLAGGPLPVSFVDVKASLQSNNSSKVEWTIGGELNADHYEVEYSTNGSSFAKIGQVAATGNNSGTINYSYVHTTPVAGINYYRIKMVDKSGGSKTSIIVKVTIGIKGEPGIVVYPNPASTQNAALQLRDLPAGKYEVQVIGSNGQLVSSQQLSHSGGTVSRMLKLPAVLQKGVYHVILYSADKTRYRTVLTITGN